MEVRAIQPDEVELFLRRLSLAFGDAHADEDEVAADRALIEPDRTFAAIDDGEIVGCAGVFTQRMVVPGDARMPTAGVTLVGVLPTHRRRGILRELMTRMLEQAIERAEAMASLFASQGAIYGRFGFGHAAFHLTFDVALDRVAWMPGLEPTGRVRLRTHAEALPAMREVYERAYTQRPGSIEVRPEDFETVFREPSKDEEKPFHAVHEDDRGVPDAFAMYRVKHTWPRGLPSSTLKVRRFVAATPDGGASLWRYLFDVDLVSRVKANTRPADDPLLLQLAEPRALRPELDDGLFLRPLDVVAALQGRGYAADGKVTLGITDGFLPALNGTYELAVEGGRASVRRVDAAADVDCPVNVLGSVAVGGTTWSALANAGVVTVRTPAALGTLDAMHRADVAPLPIVYF